MSRVLDRVSLYILMVQNFKTYEVRYIRSTPQEADRAMGHHSPRMMFMFGFGAVYARSDRSTCMLMPGVRCWQRGAQRTLEV